MDGEGLRDGHAPWKGGEQGSNTEVDSSGVRGGSDVDTPVWKSMKDQVLDWIENKLEVPHAMFGNLPICPYVRAARIAGTISIHEVFPGENRTNQYCAWRQGQQAMVFVVPTSAMSAEQAQLLVEEIEEELTKLDLIVYFNHPASDGSLNGVDVSFGKATLIIVQRRSELIEASRKLRNTGYYDHWPLDEYNQLVKARE